MGSDISREQEETKQKEIQLQIEQVKAKQQDKALAYETVRKQQEMQENLALNKNFCIIHGGVTVAKDGIPRLQQTILASDTGEEFEVCYNLFCLNSRKNSEHY